MLEGIKTILLWFLVKNIMICITKDKNYFKNNDDQINLPLTL
jgi:hypothetical protein